MKLVKPSFEIIEQEAGREGLLRHIEKCGRTCYKSEDKITEDSAEKFVNMLVNRGHTAMVEHGTVYLAIPMTTYAPEAVNTYLNNPYSEVNECNEFIFKDKYGDSVSAWCVTTNFRVLLQNNCLEDLEFLCEPTKYHTKRVTVKFTCDRGVSHEFVRHRVFSFAQESTRYCNYSKDKFGNEITCIIPCWCDDLAGGNSYDISLCEDYDLTTTEGLSKNSARWIYYMCQAESAYNLLLAKGWVAQQARAVLPNSLKTELVMTGTIDQWKGFFALRDDKQHAHPQAYELAHPLHEEFIKRGYITE